ncbi:MAG: glucuronate isomerase [Clostridia bacterium]|nr:glucuronate isomerase [Clostridia bacterium]
MTYMDKDFLLYSETAKKLYHEYAASQPICDFHCHIDASVLSKNQPFRDLTDIWLGGDHYKWRAMRQAGIPECLITGDADPKDKLMAWADVVPDLIGNPLYHWTHLELQRYFQINRTLNPKSAKDIWETANACLKQPSFLPIQLLLRMNVKILCTTDDPISTLSDHEALAGRTDDMKVIPASRPDRYLRLLSPTYKEAVDELADSVKPGGCKIESLDDLAYALQSRARYFHAHGCRLSDHALDCMPQKPESRAAADALFKKRLRGQELTPEEAAKVQFVILTDLASIYDELGWTWQLHMGALRNTSRRAFERLGPDTGFDAILDEPIALPLATLLNACEENNHLPRTLLYSLNANDNMILTTLASTFVRDGEPAWVTQGPAWWFHDQKDGIECHLKQYSQIGILSNFVGMTTDSRSLLSYTRHEYFRRIFCNQIGALVESGEYPADWPVLSRLVKRVCFENAASLFA